VFAGCRYGVRILHTSLDTDLLSQDSPEPSTARHQQPHAGAVAGQLQRRTSINDRGNHGPALLVVAAFQTHVDAGQAQD